MMSKIGVLTFHRCINYGSYWQARCLVEGLRACRLDAVILDHHSPRVKRAEWKCAFRPTLPTAVPPTDFPFYRQKMKKFLCAFNKLPLSTPFDLENPAQAEEYDLIIVGSDEVWNLCHPWYGGYSVFYGDGLRAERLISYAASFGSYDASWGLEQNWASKLNNFAAISVRDENSRKIINNALGISPEIVLDPCLQFPAEPEKREEKYPAGSYVAVYGHNFSGRFAGAIRRWTKEKALSLISIGYRNDWADEQWLAADPHDFAHFIRRARAVATNFFHGCVFALRYGKSFVCEKTQYRSNKIFDLVTLLGCQKHLLTENAADGEYGARLSAPLDHQVLGTIERLRHVSHEYLGRTIGLPRQVHA